MAKDAKAYKNTENLAGRTKPKAAGKPSEAVLKNAEPGKYVIGHRNPKDFPSVPVYSSGSVLGRDGPGVENKKGQHAEPVLERSLSRPESRLTSIEKMDLTRKGISKKDLEQLKKRAGLDYSQLSYILQVARATLIAKKGAEKFPSLLSEKIMSLADIYSYGYEVFGSEKEFNKWIFQPIAALGGKAPYEIMDNQYGREEVKHIIGRIEYGVYS